VLAGVGFEAYGFHFGEFVDGCQDGICWALEEVTRAWEMTCLGSRRLDLRLFGGRSDHILVIFGMGVKSLLPLTSRAVVRGIARDPD